MDKTISLTVGLEQFRPLIMDCVKEVVSKKDAGLLGSNKIMYNGSEVAKLLGVTLRTLQNYRDKGELGYIRIGKTIFYQEENIIDFMKKHSEKPFAHE